VLLFGCFAATAAEPLLTVAEQSEFKSTSRYADVTSFCDQLAKRPNVRLSTFGTSHEGRTLPLLTIAEPPVSSPEEAAKSGKLVVLAFANIHAGEVDGKEALLALARELSAEKSHPLLKDLVILLVPILNADGNEKIDVKNRPEQNGPVNGVGIRENAQGLDLNRDFIKLESPEIRALVKLFNAWDPSVIIDCHTTNGSRHRYTLTYDGPRYPSTDGPLPEWVNNTMLPEAGKRVKAATGFDTAPYGNFNKEKTRWETYPSLPRYSIQYIALRNRIGILSESYSYASFKDRVIASGAFVKACFEIAAEKKADVKRIIAEPPKNVVLRTETVAFDKKRTILGFDGDAKKDYELEDIARVKPKLMVAMPEVGYLMPAKPAAAIETLHRHGIQVQELREDIDLAVDAQMILSIDTESKPFQKHLFTTVGVQSRPATKRVKSGSVFVPIKQPLGSLAAYLLEPSTEDGLTTWGLFTDELPAPGQDFPVLRLNKAVPMNLGPVAALPEDKPKEKKPITDAMLFAGGGFGLGFSGRTIPNPTWLADGEHFLQVKDGKLWTVKARTGEAELFVQPEKLKQSLAAYKDQADAASKRIPTRMNPDKTGMLLDIGGDLVLAHFDGTPAVKLAKTDASREHLTFAPKGNRLAFIRGSNLIVFADGAEKQLTTDGGGEILNAKGDWVYEEEIFMRAGQAYWWSPDGTKIAFLRFDDAPVKKFNIVDLRGTLETWRYPKSGDPNPLVSLHVADVIEGKTTKLDLGVKPEDMVISRVGWMPDSKSPFAYVQNRTQTWLDFTVWSEGKPKALFRDSTKAWIDDAGPPHFLPDGSFLFPSDRSGYRHLYLYSAEGKLQKAVTKGEWEVRDVLRVDGKDGDLFFTGTMDGHVRTHLYRGNLDREGTLRLTEAKGSHQVVLAPKGGLFIDRFTDHGTPTQVHLVEWADDPRSNFHTSLFPRIRTLDSNPVPQREEYRFGKFEAVQVPMPDGFKLEGTLVYPPDFDPKKKYPVWLMTYAGPHMPSVREGFGGGRILDQVLAASGIVVFRVDPRSASGESAQAAWTAYKQLGVQELKDLEAAVAWLGKNEWMDSSRVGISGHSYGGFMAGYALTHSKVFSAGIASSGVMDWRLYDTIYTERYMLTPKENPDGYDKSSVVKAAKNLHGKLLILHGMMDDNVHVQNSVQFVDALQAAGKQFEMMFYPRSRHGIASPHYLKLELEFIRRTMGVK
jgi:dipeptidyl aminopeptidase/acylaminoacyl peptidase